MTLMVLITIFVAAFVLNLIWEYAHHGLYQNYKGGEITNTILLRATLCDAIFLTIAFQLVYGLNFSNPAPSVIIISLLGAWYFEHYAHKTNRWSYGPKMPIIPLLNVGLTPILQLPLISLIMIWIA